METIETICELQDEYNEKMAKLLNIAENVLPEFKDSVYEIDVLILKILSRVRDNEYADNEVIKTQLKAAKAFINAWAKILYNFRKSPNDWINVYPVTDSIEKNFEYLSNEILLLEEERGKYEIRNISEI